MSFLSLPSSPGPGGGPGRSPERIDPRTALAVGALALLGGAVYLGDQATFVRPAANGLEALLAYLPAWGYLLLGDRLAADVLAGAVGAGLFTVAALRAYDLVLHHVVEPSMVKQMIAAKRREQANLNRFGDDTF